ncbi:MAG: conjugal transfer protein TraF [bacterium]|nr:conjugal transfer protein TraF [bacterium]MDT8365015.1 conjugal transfer protein TraF [bacterium]
MKRISIFTVVVLVALAFVSAAWALPFPITDVRALGMGGAFVAAGEGIGAVQYNPALLGKDSTVGVVVPEIVARIEDHIGLVDLIDDLNNAVDTADTTQMIAILNQLDQGGALDIQASAAAGAGFGLFGISAGATYSQLIYGTAYPDHIYTTQDAGLLDSANNTLELRGMEARQIILTGAKSFGNIIVGANLRNIQATVFSDSESLFSDPGIGIGDVTAGTEQDESATAFDVGAVMGLTPLLDVGIVAKDVGGTDLGVVEFDPRYRVGAALHLPMITVAADYDVTKDDTGGTDYQDWALGAEFDVWAIALRAGLSNNSGLSAAPTLIHLGVGLGFLDIGAAYAEDGDYYMAGVNLSLGF